MPLPWVAHYDYLSVLIIYVVPLEAGGSIEIDSLYGVCRGCYLKAFRQFVLITFSRTDYPCVVRSQFCLFAYLGDVLYRIEENMQVDVVACCGGLEPLAITNHRDISERIVGVDRDYLYLTGIGSFYPVFRQIGHFIEPVFPLYRCC